MGEIPGWITEQLQTAGWVVVESLETFDAYLGDRFRNRAVALQKALTGDAILASRGTASMSCDVEGEFFVGRLRRSAEPIAAPDDERLLVYSLDSVERHVKLTVQHEQRPETEQDSSKSRLWSCPECERTCQLLAEEPEIPENKAHCPECSEAPSEFAPGQVVRVCRAHGSRTRLGVVDTGVQADCVDGVNVGPFTGEYMVWHLNEAYGSDAPVTPDFEQNVFATLPIDAARRRALASLFMTGTSATPDQISALEPEEESRLFE